MYRAHAFAYFKMIFVDSIGHIAQAGIRHNNIYADDECVYIV